MWMRALWKPSSMIRKSQPPAISRRAAAARSAVTTVGAASASSNGSSPTWRALSVRASTRCGSRKLPPWPRDRKPGESPALRAAAASARATGVLPAPPTVRLPTHITGAPTRTRGAPLRRKRATAP